MDATMQAQFIEALRTDEGFRTAVRRELVGEQLLSLLRSATEMAARDVNKLPEERAAFEDLGRTVQVLVDVVAVHRQDLDRLLRGNGGSGGSGSSSPGPEANPILIKVARAMEELSTNLQTVEGRVDAVTAELERQAQELSRLSESTNQFVPLAGAGFSAVQDALNGMLEHQRATQRQVEAMRQQHADIVVDLRDPVAVTDDVLPDQGSSRARRLRLLRRR